MVKKRRVIWSQNSKQELHEIYDHIKKDSLKNADKVRKTIVSATMNLPSHPKRYAVDKYKINNDGTFRAFQVFQYRIVYQVTETDIIILRVRHTSMEPLNY